MKKQSQDQCTAEKCLNYEESECKLGFSGKFCLYFKSPKECQDAPQEAPVEPQAPEAYQGGEKYPETLKTPIPSGKQAIRELLEEGVKARRVIMDEIDRYLGKLLEKEKGL